MWMVAWTRREDLPLIRGLMCQWVLVWDLFWGCDSSVSHFVVWISWLRGGDGVLMVGVCCVAEPFASKVHVWSSPQKHATMLGKPYVKGCIESCASVSWLKKEKGQLCSVPRSSCNDVTRDQENNCDFLTVLCTKIFQLHLALNTWHSVKPVLLIYETCLNIMRFEETFLHFSFCLISLESVLSSCSQAVLHSPCSSLRG